MCVRPLVGRSGGECRGGAWRVHTSILVPIIPVYTHRSACVIVSERETPNRNQRPVVGAGCSPRGRVLATCRRVFIAYRLSGTVIFIHDVWRELHAFEFEREANVDLGVSVKGDLGEAGRGGSIRDVMSASCQRWLRRLWWLRRLRRLWWWSWGA